MNVVTVKEKTARRGKMHGGEMHGGKMREGKMCEGKMRGEKIHGRKRKWNCVSIYGMIGIDVRCATCSEDRLNCVWNTEHKTAL
ncbi:MAG: hypothetical protein EGR48_08490 [Lachnospiraceae bacterium]|nr:hypothetical protein [Lachnospiraceae bacterium]